MTDSSISRLPDPSIDPYLVELMALRVGVAKMRERLRETARIPGVSWAMAELLHAIADTYMGGF